MNKIQFNHTPKHILVTGGAGFIGSNVVKQLRQSYPQSKIRVLHQARESLINLIGVSDIEAMSGDVTSAEDMANAVAGCDVVFHLAAIYAFWLPDMSLMHRVNVEGTRTVLNAALKAGIKRVVYTSSAVCFAGEGLHIRSTESSPFSMANSPYAVSKHESHLVAQSFIAKGLDVVMVCPVAPMGPGDLAPTPTGRMITEIFNYPVPISPNSEMNIIDVRDCAKGHLLALQFGRTGESYLLAGENYTYHDMLRRVLRLCGMQRPIIALPTLVLKPISKLMLMATRITKKAPVLTPTEVDLIKIGLVVDGRKAREELGLTTRPLEQTLEDALTWFVVQGQITHKHVVQKFMSH